jgi:hypothetical protein
MNRQTRVFWGSFAIGLAALTGGAQAQSVCSAVIKTESAQSSLTNATDGATPAKIRRSYNKAFARGRTAGIAAWSAKVRQDCAGQSARWRFARDKKVEACDQAMGGRFTVCVSAVPGR